MSVNSRLLKLQNNSIDSCAVKGNFGLNKLNIFFINKNKIVMKNYFSFNFFPTFFLPELIKFVELNKELTAVKILT